MSELEYLFTAPPKRSFLLTSLYEYHDVICDLEVDQYDHYIIPEYLVEDLDYLRSEVLSKGSKLSNNDIIDWLKINLKKAIKRIYKINRRNKFFNKPT